jgi:hypothetical protein
VSASCPLTLLLVRLVSRSAVSRPASASAVGYRSVSVSSVMLTKPRVAGCGPGPRTARAPASCISATSVACVRCPLLACRGSSTMVRFPSTTACGTTAGDRRVSDLTTCISADDGPRPARHQQLHRTSRRRLSPSTPNVLAASPAGALMGAAPGGRGSGFWPGFAVSTSRPARHQSRASAGIALLQTTSGAAKPGTGASPQVTPCCATSRPSA